MNTPEQAWDWPSVIQSWVGTMGGSGSKPNTDEDRSFLRSSSDKTSPGVHRDVLIVEDNEADLFLIQEAMEAIRLPLTFHVANDGEQATRFFDWIDNYSDVPCPALVILDINLPKKQGGDVLYHMRHSRRCADALVIAVSTSDSAGDRERMANLGANEYFRKPSDYDEFMKLGDIVKDLLSGPTA